MPGRSPASFARVKCETRRVENNCLVPTHQLWTGLLPRPTQWWAWLQIHVVVEQAQHPLLLLLSSERVLEMFDRAGSAWRCQITALAPQAGLLADCGAWLSGS